ncbi:ATP-dependent RNA helicase FAL1 [Echinococcus granulosus]|uniref:RNA helicase n=1 Tax=Echinococcus granulosus TaxID=6210 RepID=A0A068WGG3_ECHGR|nr:ATP-dependent RNA helicase FAL1 [Echinococcus granulosus]CDS18820.1 eukaryotic initiation factor 4A III [Echinococcus granulosus]
MMESLFFNLRGVRTHRGVCEMLENLKASSENREDIALSENVPVITSFKEMGLKSDLLRGIYDYGYERPSLVQQRAISQIIRGRDVVVQAQSGTGKTATFCIGTLQLLDPSRRETQALFLAPTRELASQVHRVVTALADHLSIKCVLCCGGRNNVGQMSKSLGLGYQIVVGTPGRILDLLRSGFLKPSNLRITVIDEADEMLNRGLREQLELIFKYLPAKTRNAEVEPSQGVVKSPMQRVVVSATWTSGCRDVMEHFLGNPVCLLVPQDELSLSGITQYYIDTASEEWKFETLTDIFASICVPQTVIFVNTRHKADWLSGRLCVDGFTATAAHGDLDQATRDRVMNAFRAGRSRVLVTTDIWARGIDVQTVGLVVNYDLPQTAAVYLHRIGRSGRFGRRGLAISFVAGGDDAAHLDSIAKTYSITIAPTPANLADPTSLLELEKTQFVPSLEKGKQKSTTMNFSTGHKTSVATPMSASKKRKLKVLRNRKKRRKSTAKKCASMNLVS